MLLKLFMTLDLLNAIIDRGQIERIDSRNGMDDDGRNHI